MNIEIERIERYVFDGLEFKNLKDVQQYVEDQIGKILGSTPLRLTPADRLAVYDVIVVNRTRLCKLLSATYCPDEDSLQGENRSIFEI